MHIKFVTFLSKNDGFRRAFLLLTTAVQGISSGQELAAPSSNSNMTDFEEHFCFSQLLCKEFRAVKSSLRPEVNPI